MLSPTPHSEVGYQRNIPGSRISATAGGVGERPGHALCLQDLGQAAEGADLALYVADLLAQPEPLAQARACARVLAEPAMTLGQAGQYVTDRNPYTWPPTQKGCWLGPSLWSGPRRSPRGWSACSAPPTALLLEADPA